MQWTPEGRRLLTGSSSGEFTLWNGMGFNFETIMQVKKPFGSSEHNADFFLFSCLFFPPFSFLCAKAHDCAIRACQYSHGGDWMLSGDQDGFVKYWQPNFNNVKILHAHNEPVRDLS